MHRRIAPNDDAGCLVTTLATTPLRALVLDDEWVARNYLVELLHASGLAVAVGAVGTTGDAREALTGDSRVDVDVVFVDVRLTGSGDDGLDFARELLGLESKPMVVLATAFRDHAIEAFELGVVDYLLKPFTEERVEQCLRRLHSRRQAAVRERPLRIVARRGRNLVFFEPAEVLAFEAAARMTSVHTARGVFDIDLSLAAIESSFGNSLTRVHRNWLVNVAHIKELERDGADTRVLVTDGTEGATTAMRIPVARERAQYLRDLLLSNATGLRR